MNYRTDYTVDTHALIWYLEGHGALTKTAKVIIDKVMKGDLVVSVSAITFLEAFHSGIRKTDFDFEKFRTSLELPNILIIPVEEKILKISYGLPKKLDIHDRLIAATAAMTSSVLVTKDPELRKLKEIKTIW